MTRLSGFLDDDAGAVTIDWVALTAGILLLGIMVVYAIFNNGVAGLVGNINGTLAAVGLDVDTGAAPDLNGVAVASVSGPMVLPNGTSIPADTAITNSVPGQALIVAPDGSAVIINNSTGFDLGAGTTISSATTFTQADGTIIQSADIGVF